MKTYVFNKKYFALAVLLFITEVFIASFVHDRLIRPYGGDFLVVMLVYCFIKAFINCDVRRTSAWVLFFAYVVEITQYFHLVAVLGWQHSAIARNLLGTTFRWIDLLAYMLGMLVVVMIEARSAKTNYRNKHEKNYRS